ncbi:hypothetical protein ACWOE5_05720 [Aerococcus sanguinicola]|nr:hypothetical protein [Aerococcus sanguinicola]MDK7050231.1 hypothetical protein [Aerococcus sanguinicola]
MNAFINFLMAVFFIISGDKNPGNETILKFIGVIFLFFALKETFIDKEK